jgi:predicted protein tyrosine phosphatase
MFRGIDLPGRIPGKLLLHSMPGRYEALERVWDQVRRDQVGTIVCLTELDEIAAKSSEYAQALENGLVPCAVLSFEVPDRGAPADREGFWQLTGDVARRLHAGEVVLIHCAGGVGRTAMLAICVLLMLGQPRATARDLVSLAGSTVETAAQSELIAWCAARLGMTD